MTEIAARLVRPIRRLGPLSLTAIGLAVLVVAVTTFVLVRAYTLRDSVLPGVRVAGVDVGGMSRPDARGRIETVIGERLRRPVDIAIGSELFTVTPSNLFTVDATATERIAFDAARDSFLDRVGAVVVPVAVEHEVEPVLVANQTAHDALAKELAERTHRPVSASVSMDGREPVVVPGRAGTAVDAPAVVCARSRRRPARAPTVEAPVTTIDPAITTAEAEQAPPRRERLSPLQCTCASATTRSGGSGREIAQLIALRADGGRLRAVAGRQGLRTELAPLVERFLKEPKDASFRVSGKRVHVVKGRDGTTLDVVGAEAADPRRGAEPGAPGGADRPRRARAEAHHAEARALGIRRQISTFTTDMGVSSSNRIWNVHLMADYIDGTIIKPGQVFSFNKAVGPRTPERGFREGQMILGSLLLPAIGGGVCQTATTLFNNAFELGLPVKSGTTTRGTSATTRSAATRPSPGAGPTLSSRTTSTTRS